MPEPPSVMLRYVVVAGQDAGREGHVVDILEMEELFDDHRAWFLGWMRVRPRRRWRATWLVLEFDEGDQGAYRLSDLKRSHG